MIMFGNFMLQLMQFEKRSDGEVNDYYIWHFATDGWKGRGA